jgi:hypothetical protein
MDIVMMTIAVMAALIGFAAAVQIGINKLANSNDTIRRFLSDEKEEGL